MLIPVASLLYNLTKLRRSLYNTILKNLSSSFGNTQPLQKNSRTVTKNKPRQLPSTSPHPQRSDHLPRPRCLIYSVKKSSFYKFSNINRNICSNGNKLLSTGEIWDHKFKISRTLISGTALVESIKISTLKYIFDIYKGRYAWEIGTSQLRLYKSALWP